MCVTEESNLAAAAIPVRKSRILPAAQRLFVSHWEGRRCPQSPILNFSRFNASLLAWHSPRFMRRVAACVAPPLLQIPHVGTQGFGGGRAYERRSRRQGITSFKNGFCQSPAAAYMPHGRGDGRPSPLVREERNVGVGAHGPIIAYVALEIVEVCTISIICSP